jgi:hypothetical protein
MGYKRLRSLQPAALMGKLDATKKSVSTPEYSPSIGTLCDRRFTDLSNYKSSTRNSRYLCRYRTQRTDVFMSVGCCSTRFTARAIIRHCSFATLSGVDFGNYRCRSNVVSDRSMTLQLSRKWYILTHSVPQYCNLALKYLQTEARLETSAKL